MRVSFYGRLVDVFGRDCEVDAATPCSIGEMRRRLQASRPEEQLGDGRLRACVNGALVSDSHVVREGDTVEFLAPVSGG